MAFRVNYRAAQGQQGQGTPGGGYLLDQVQQVFGGFVSGASRSTYVGIVPQFDTRDFVVSILSDVEPQSFTPHPVIGRVTLALATSVASIASTSSPLVQLVRRRISSTGSSTWNEAVVATWDYSAMSVSLPWLPKTVSGSLISNGVLNAGDVLTLNNTPVSATIAVASGGLVIDWEA